MIPRSPLPLSPEVIFKDALLLRLIYAQRLRQGFALTCALCGLTVAQAEKEPKRK